jgi:serine/threonine protein kinase
MLLSKSLSLLALAANPFVQGQPTGINSEVTQLESRAPSSGKWFSCGAYQLFKSKYIADGGNGYVYKGMIQLRSTTPTTAIKQFKSDARGGYRYVSMLPDDDHLMKVWTSCTSRDGTDFIVTEWVDGKDLFDLTYDGALRSDERISRPYISSMTGLVAIHGAGLSHGDIKPDNIRFVSNLPRSIAKIIDYDTLSKHARRYVMCTAERYAPPGK